MCVCVCVFKREKDGFTSQRITVSLTSPRHLSFVLWRGTSPILMVKLDWPWPSCIFKVIDGLFPRNGFLKHMIREAERRIGKSLWFLLASRWFQLREKLKLPLSFTKSSHCHLRHTTKASWLITFSPALQTLAMIISMMSWWQRARLPWRSTLSSMWIAFSIFTSVLIGHGYISLWAGLSFSRPLNNWLKCTKKTLCKSGGWEAPRFWLKIL